MVGKWSCINPLTIEERRKVKEALDLNMTYSEMSLHVGRCKSVVMRESKRLGDVKIYDPEKAQEDFEEKQKRFEFRESLKNRRLSSKNSRCV